MATFDSTKTALKSLLDQIVEGKIQLPDFQRGWVWDDSHIRSLLVSIARSFPIGSVMLLETGGAARFQIRPIEGVEFPHGAKPAVENLVLDGQQRLTSLTQVLKLAEPVATRDSKGKEIKRYYYFDIEKVLAGNGSLDDAILSIDETRTVKTNFGRDVVLDLGSPKFEYEHLFFPCNRIFDKDGWEQGLMGHSLEKFKRYMDFRRDIIEPFTVYQVPVIQLKKETTKEAVCLVFEKVNTGGVPLSVFELATATYAADGFNLRDDWYGRSSLKIEGRHKKFARQPLLIDLQPTEFLQGLTLLHSYERRKDDIAAGKTGKEVAAVSAKREHVLALPLSAYQEWADQLMAGFFEADRFLRMEGFHHPKFLPYRSQIIPLATTMTHLGERWLEPVIRKKLARWYWCGVLGELYGGAIEFRIANDFTELLAWINESNAPEPVTVSGAGFQASRLDTLRTRTSAAYRGIYVLLQRQGSKDFFWKARMVDLDRDECKIDIHHIFPQDWCEKRGISARIYNSILNKTPISYKANRMIGGKAPSEYLEQIRKNPQVQSSVQEQDELLATHLIPTEALRANAFEDFMALRKQALLALIAEAMGKDIESIVADENADLELDEEDPELELIES